MLGNWAAHSPDTTDTTLDQEREHNYANEITDIESDLSGTPSDWVDFACDAAGNMTTQGTSSSTSRTFKWDAWGRLREVKYDGDYRTRHAYYPGHQRAWTVADEVVDANEDPTRWNLFYYDAAWRLLEHRYDDDVSAEDWDHWDDPEGVDCPDFDDDEATQYVWGLNYIDELVYFRKGLTDGRYALTDRNYSVIALLEDDAGDADDERMARRDRRADVRVRKATIGDVHIAIAVQVSLRLVPAADQARDV